MPLTFGRSRLTLARMWMYEMQAKALPLEANSYPQTCARVCGAIKVVICSTEKLESRLCVCMFCFVLFFNNFLTACKCSILPPYRNRSL
jgi:hypothetical protein